MATWPDIYRQLWIDANALSDGGLGKQAPPWRVASIPEAGLDRAVSSWVFLAQGRSVVEACRALGERGSPKVERLPRGGFNGKPGRPATRPRDLHTLWVAQVSVEGWRQSDNQLRLDSHSDSAHLHP